MSMNVILTTEIVLKTVPTQMEVTYAPVMMATFQAVITGCVLVNLKYNYAIIWIDYSDVNELDSTHGTCTQVCINTILDILT